MGLRSLTYTILGSALFLVLSGCSQFYTGGLGLSFSSRKTIEDYQKFKTQREAQLKSGKLARKRSQPVAFQDIAARARMGGPAQGGVFQYAANMSNQSLGAMGLFGQLKPVRDARSSPMDGLDNLQRVTATSEGADFDPVIDPSGAVMYYASTRHRQTADIYRMQVGQTSVTQLTNDPANDLMPVISPDGSKIAFASDRSGNWDIYLMDAGGGKPLLLTLDSPTDDIHPSFSPDGTKLVYCSLGGVSGQWEMVVIDLARPAAKQYIGLGLFPTWSPVGNKILYQRARQRGTRWFSVWSIDIQESGNVSSPTELAASANAAAITPQWSPDGKYIVFCTVIDPQTDDQSRPVLSDLWVMNADGSGRMKLTGGHYANLQPAWSTAGRIYFVSDRGVDGVENVYSMEPARAIKLAASARKASETTSVMVPTP